MQLAKYKIWTVKKRVLSGLRKVAKRLAAAESGSVAAEYAFLVALVGIVAAFGMILLGDDLFAYFKALSVGLDNAAQPTPDPFAT